MIIISYTAAKVNFLTAVYTLLKIIGSQFYTPRVLEFPAGPDLTAFSICQYVA